MRNNVPTTLLYVTLWYNDAQELDSYKQVAKKMQEQLQEFGEEKVDLGELAKNYSVAMTDIEEVKVGQSASPFAYTSMAVSQALYGRQFPSLVVVPPKPEPKTKEPTRPTAGKSRLAEGCVNPNEAGLVEIHFSPSRNRMKTKEDDEVRVVSEFTGWKPEPLLRETRGGDAIYVGRFRLQPGFKYKFRFLVNGMPINDAGYPDTKNTMGQAYNYVVVPNESGTVPLLKHSSYMDPAVLVALHRNVRLTRRSGRKE